MLIDIFSTRSRIIKSRKLVRLLNHVHVEVLPINKQKNNDI